MSRLKTTYDKEIASKLMSKLSLKNKHDVPKIDKIILNMGLGEDGSDGKKIKACLDDMALITGQKPVITKFKKSISNFKTRKGSNAGIKEHIVFPEVNFDKVDKIRGLDITIVTSSKNKQGTLELLKEFNFPLNEKKN